MGISEVLVLSQWYAETMWYMNRVTLARLYWHWKFPTYQGYDIHPVGWWRYKEWEWESRYLIEKFKKGYKEK